MALFEISPKDYEIFASIMKDGPGMRHQFTVKELFDTLKRVGFALEPNGWLTYDGKALRISRSGDKGRTVVSFSRQDELKQKMYKIFGWTKGSFVAHSGV